MTRNFALSEVKSSFATPSLASRYVRGSIIGMLAAGSIEQIWNLDYLKPEAYWAAAITLAFIVIWQWYQRYHALVGMLQSTLSQWHTIQNVNTAKALIGKPPGALITEFRHMIEQSFETHRMQMQLRMQLSACQNMLSNYQSMISIHTDMQQLLKHITHYTHMLEESIAQRNSPAGLHDAFDELSEQSFNLQLFIAAFERLSKPHHYYGVPDTINPIHTLSRILVPLTPALDRRAMQLSSAAWDEHVQARINAPDLELIAWLMLLGTVRYAEDESTLILSCEPSANDQHTTITCLVTELAPATMAPYERTAFMQTQQKHQSAHMFAHTLASSTNITLAKQIAEATGGSLAVHARTQTCCLVELTLPR